MFTMLPLWRWHDNETNALWWFPLRMNDRLEFRTIDWRLWEYACYIGLPSVPAQHFSSVRLDHLSLHDGHCHASDCTITPLRSGEQSAIACRIGLPDSHKHSEHSVVTRPCTSYKDFLWCLPCFLHGLSEDGQRDAIEVTMLHQAPIWFQEIMDDFVQDSQRRVDASHEALHHRCPVWSWMSEVSLHLIQDAAGNDVLAGLPLCFEDVSQLVPRFFLAQFALGEQAQRMEDFTVDALFVRGCARVSEFAGAFTHRTDVRESVRRNDDRSQATVRHALHADDSTPTRFRLALLQLY